VLALGGDQAGPAGDLGFREQVAIWPLLVLILLMGVCSPYWMRAIDGFVTTNIVSPQTAVHTTTMPTSMPATMPMPEAK
jgi:NADH-quinone oxidoreductase subunit M